MKSTKFHIVCLLIIILIASILRLFKLDQNPPSLYWDETSLGYNAFAILTTGHDEHGESFPLTRFIAFGDYKPPGYIYSIVPWMALFGINEFAIRFPSALSGILLVLVTYFLALELTKNKAVGLAAAVLLAISPWSLQLSRAAFEAHLAAIFNAGAILAFMMFPRRKWLLLMSMFLFVLSFYTFNANRVLAPLFVLLLGFLYRKELWQAKKWVIVSLVIGVVLM